MLKGKDDVQMPCTTDSLAYTGWCIHRRGSSHRCPSAKPAIPVMGARAGFGGHTAGALSIEADRQAASAYGRD